MKAYWIGCSVKLYKLIPPPLPLTKFNLSAVHYSRKAGNLFFVWASVLILVSFVMEI
jgi:hypothetical protein